MTGKHKNVIALDPSLTKTGIAVFKGEKLIEAGHIKPPKEAKNFPLPYRLATIADEICHAFLDSESKHFACALEYPQIYTASKAKGDPNKLAMLCALCGAVSSLLIVSGACQVLYYKPAQWAGQVPKFEKGNTKKSPRAQRIYARLSDKERVIFDGLKNSDHDAIDAIGIGMHYLGRGIKAGQKVIERK